MTFADLSGSDADGIALVDAGALTDRGIGVDDVVGLLSPNSSAFAVAFGRIEWVAEDFRERDSLGHHQ